MVNFIKKIIFWLNCARVYSLPITVLNWIVIFIYSLKSGGNAFLGLAALIGISLVHMATNLTDDYFDYKILSKDEKYLNSAQNCKCLYLKNNQATTEELKFVIFIFLGIASIIGGVLFFMSGYYVALLAFIGLCVAAGYQKLSISGKGEIAIFIAYGPLLYEGTYYVMTGKFSFDVLFLSIACVFMTITVLYAHMLMDYDGDESSHKITLCRKFKNKTSALKFILVFYLLGFLNISAFAILTRNYYYFLSFLTLPLIIDLYKSLNAFNHDKMNIPQIKFWHYPLDGWEKIKNTQDAPFYFRFFYVRNILIWFLLLICIGIIL